MDTTLVDALREALQRETGASVAVVETHISWVLLTSSLAYKLKKPVRLPFLDFSSLSARKHFCEEELRLNRRFAPSLYLDVVPICGTRASPRLGGTSAPIDHVVRMRRFAESSLLRHLVATDQCRPEWLEAFGRHLASLHAAADRGQTAAHGHDAVPVLHAAKQALGALRGKGNDAQISVLDAWIEAQGQALLTACDRRQQAGAVRDCHGDLHLGNVVMLDGALSPFDRIEFEPALRWIDVMNDTAFLTMDLKAHGRSDLAFRFLDGWLQHSGDYSGLQVWGFYEVYRALVRAMVCELGPKASNDDARPDYLGCAVQRATRPSEGARLLITHGFSGSGKSRLSQALMCKTGAVRVRSDVERKRLYGLQPTDRCADGGIDIYSADATRRTFERLRTCARDVLQAGYPVIVDAAFLRRDERRSFQALAAELGVRFAILHCRADVSTLRRRVAQRETIGTDASDAGLAVLERQMQSHDPLAPDERALTLEVWTGENADVHAIAAGWRAPSPCG